MSSFSTYLAYLGTAAGVAACILYLMLGSTGAAALAMGFAFVNYLILTWALK